MEGRQLTNEKRGARMQLHNSAFVLLFKTKFIAVAIIAMGTVFAMQDGVLPPMTSVSSPDTENPFDDYVESNKEESSEDPFSDYVKEASSRDAETSEQEDETSAPIESVVQNEPAKAVPNAEPKASPIPVIQKKPIVQGFQTPPAAPNTTAQRLQPPPTRRNMQADRLFDNATSANNGTAANGTIQRSSRNNQAINNAPPVNNEVAGNSVQSLAPLRAAPRPPVAITNPQAQPLVRNNPPVPAINTPRQEIIVDHNVRPMNFNQPITSPPTNSPPPVAARQPARRKVSANIMVAQNLLKELATAEQQSASSGQPMQLLDMLANSSMSRRKELIAQYWATYGAWADYRFAIDELRWIQQVGQVRSEADRKTLEAAQSAANDSIAARALELSDQQHKLNQFLSGPKSESLPLPTDSPLVTRYRTNFDLFAARQSMPENLRVINLWLPEQQKLIGDRAVTVQRCRAAVSQATQAISQGQNVPSLLHTIDLCRDCHSDFVDTVVKYNQRIAEYALTVRPNKPGAEQVVAMLIPAASTSATSPAMNQTRQATLQGTPYQPANRMNNGNQGRSMAPPTPALAPRNQSNGVNRGGFGSGASPNSNDGMSPRMNGQLPPRRNVPSDGTFESPATAPPSGFGSGGSPGGFRPGSVPGAPGSTPPSAPQAGGGFRR